MIFDDSRKDRHWYVLKSKGLTIRLSTKVPKEAGSWCCQVESSFTYSLWLIQKSSEGSRLSSALKQYANQLFFTFVFKISFFDKKGLKVTLNVSL